MIVLPPQSATEPQKGTTDMNTIDLPEVVDVETASELEALERILETPALEPDRSGYIFSYRY